MAAFRLRDLGDAIRDGVAELRRRLGRPRRRTDDGVTEAPTVAGVTEAPTVAGGAGVWHRYVHAGPDGDRPHLVYTPPGRAPWRGAPLVVLLHGCRQDPRAIAATTRMHELADRHRFVVVAPQQLPERNPRRCWNWFRQGHQQRGDGEPAAIAALTIATANRAGSWRIDPRRIYVIGMSAGGAMASVLAATYPDVYAAIGVHSGLGYGAARSLRGAYRAMRRGTGDVDRRAAAALRAMGDRARVVPTIVVQGGDDETVHPVNGVETVQQWMATNRAVDPAAYDARWEKPDVSDQREIAGRRVVVHRWRGPRGPVVQEFWTIDGLGHAWSGGTPGGSYSDPHGPDASSVMLRFLRRHAM